LKIYISQGSVATQLRFDGILQIFPQNVAVKNISKIRKYLATMWTKVCGLLFGHPVSPGACRPRVMRSCLHTATAAAVCDTVS